jgi:hypothetical protein
MRNLMMGVTAALALSITVHSALVASYPTSVKTFTTKASNDVIQPAHINDLQDEVVAIEGALLNGFEHNLIPESTGDARNLGATTDLWNDIFLNGEVYERGRTTAAGEWTTPSFSAGTFTANGSMTWTVAAGDVGTYAYTLIGKTMTVVFTINTATVGGTPDTALRIAVPASQTAAKATANPVLILDNGTRAIGIASVGAGDSVISIQREDNASWTASANNNYVQGQITFEVS